MAVVRKDYLPFLSLILIGFTFGIPTALSNEAGKVCQPPEQGPAWLRDLTEEQKRGIDVEWEAEVESNSGTYEINGKYELPPSDGKDYLSYQNKVKINLVETWNCSAEGPEIVAIKGVMENDIEYEAQTQHGLEATQFEDEYAVVSPTEIRHIKRWHKTKIEGSSEKENRVYEEKESWTQNWDGKIAPYMKGEMTAKTVIKRELPLEEGPAPKQLASVGIALEAFHLQKHYQEVIEEEGRFDGPPDLVEINRKAQSKIWMGELEDEPLHRRELESKEKRNYKFDPNSRSFQFVDSTEISNSHEFKTDNSEGSKTYRVSVWDDLEKPPTKTASWKESFTSNKSGYTNSFSVSSEGNKSLPKVFGINAQDGTISRVTEFNEQGKLIRFLVVYFPGGGRPNETKVDINFKSDGFVDNYSIQSGELSFNQEPGANITNDTAFQIRKAINEANQLENVPDKYCFTKHTFNARNYPRIRVAHTLQ